MSELTALVFGASGITGGNFVEHLLNSNKAKWRVIATATKPPKFQPWFGNDKVTFLSVDLTDANDCKKKITENEDIANVGYVFYAAYKQSSDENEMVEVNSKMFKNALDAVLPKAKNLKKIALNTGAKYYGVHKGPYKTPAEESDPRIQGPMFYYNQEDMLADYQKGQSWTYSITRPLEILGYSKGYMNLMHSLAVYATFCKELGLKFKYPGNTKSWEVINEASDVDLISELIEHCFLSGHPGTENQAFNITNGDSFRWKHLWPRLAEYFKLEWEGPKSEEKMNLVKEFGGKDEEWKRIAEKYDLRFKELKEAATFDFADAVFGRTYDSLESMNKAREAGFLGWINTEKSYCKIFDKLRALKVIPKW